jgi:hypothetical protein
MGDNIWVEEILPDLHHFSLAATPFKTQIRQDFGQHGADRAGTRLTRFLQSREIDATPLGTHTLTRGEFGGADGGDIFGREGKHAFWRKELNALRG